MSALETVDVNTNYDVGEGAENQYLTFMLMGEEYGVDILRVQEIRCWQTVTTLPNAPVYVKGVVNIRGSIVPVVDLRMRFGMEEVEYTPVTVVIVVKVLNEEGRERVMGVVVDTVSDTYIIPEENMKPAPEFGDSIDLTCVKGLATVNDNMLILLDIDRLLNSDELTVLERG